MSSKGSFIDEAKILVRAGQGGNGCVSFRREKYVPRGGPDGGDGAPGGSVILKADKRLRTLIDFKYRRELKAERGTHGQGSNKTGRAGKNLVIRVPVGTVVEDEEGNVLADLVKPGQQVTVAKGGRGGRGNARFASSTNQAPRFAEKGEPGEEKRLVLKLKLLADVGIVGYPNVGKSSLIARVSAAKPKIAEYPFTTLRPHLGVVSVGDNSFVLADIPGLIEGAHLGKGLGISFLKHIERCQIILHLLDLSLPQSLIEAYQAVRRELDSYSSALSQKVEVIAGNKIDLPQAKKKIPELESFFKKKGLDFFPISVWTGEGIEKLLNHLGSLVQKLPSVSKETGKRVVYQSEKPFEVKKLREGVYRVKGAEVERLVAMIDFNSRDSLEYFWKQVKFLGVEKLLVKKGASEGDLVKIGKMEFVFKPSE